jgi:hypothetical protein
MTDPINTNNQYQVTQIETITFGVLSALFALIAVIFAYLQLRQMHKLRYPREQPDSDVELGLGQSYITILVYPVTDTSQCNIKVNRPIAQRPSGSLQNQVPRIPSIKPSLDHNNPHTFYQRQTQVSRMRQRWMELRWTTSMISRKDC